MTICDTNSAISMGSSGFLFTHLTADTDCVMLWSSAFIISNLWRVFIANSGLFLLACLAQYFTSLHTNRLHGNQQKAMIVYENIHRIQSSTIQDIKCCKSKLMIKPRQTTGFIHFLDSIMYGIRIFLAYMLMLAIMTYDGLMLISICMGFTIGYYLFSKYDTNMILSADPCCG